MATKATLPAAASGTCARRQPLSAFAGHQSQGDQHQQPEQNEQPAQAHRSRLTPPSRSPQLQQPATAGHHPQQATTPSQPPDRSPPETGTRPADAEKQLPVLFLLLSPAYSPPKWNLLPYPRPVPK